MKSNNYFKFFLSVSMLFNLIGACYKIMHLGFSVPILIIGMLLTLPYVIIGIIEVKNSKKINNSEKIMWTIGFLFLSLITGLIYLFFGKKRIS